jgi:CRISPR-associated endonuclease/helicase Cas3
MPKSARSERATGDDPWSEGCWQSIAEHADGVCAELATILHELPVEISRNALNVAARWHDWGKAHASFQAKLKPSALEASAAKRILDASGGFVAKAPASGWRSPDVNMAVSNGDDDGDLPRRYFRHELASALGMLQIDSKFVPDEFRDLVVYLVAAHHGKVRLSIRSLPGECAPPATNGDARRFARGVWEGDALPAANLGGGIQTPAVAGLNLEPMELGYSESGAPSWATRMLALRDEFGLFRLAFKESVLRAADWRASAKAESQGGPSYV